MKRTIILAVIIIIVATLCSCGSQASAENLSEIFGSAFLFTANFDDDGFTGEISFRKSAEGGFELLYFLPDTVSGEKITVLGETAVCTYGRTTDERAVSELPERSLIRLLIKATNTAARETAEKKTDANGNDILTYANGIKITVYCGAVKEIRFTEANTVLSISGFEKTA